MSVSGPEGTPFDPAEAYPFPQLSGDEWALWPELGEGAPRVIHGAACMDCPEQVWVDDEPLPVAVWALDHTRADPSHRQYLVSTQKHWRVDRRAEVSPSGWPPARRSPASSAARPPGERSRVSPLGPATPSAGEAAVPHATQPRLRPAPRSPLRCLRVVRRGMSRLGRYAGPLTLALFSSGCGFVLGALLATGPG